jgi:hypothetical protein
MTKISNATKVLHTYYIIYAIISVLTRTQTPLKHIQEWENSRGMRKASVNHTGQSIIGHPRLAQ